MRLASIDLLRSVAIVTMVVVHFLENLSGVREWSPDGFGAPLFALLSGVSIRLWTASRTRRGESAEQLTCILVRRGLFLFGLGLVFNFFVWLPQDFWIWDVLTCLGTASILLAFVRQMPAAAAILFVTLAVLVSPVLQQLAAYPEWWMNGYYEPGSTMSEILLGFFVTGYFPIFPWIAIPVAGFFAGAPLSSDLTSYSRPHLCRYLLVPGIVLGIISGTLLLAGSWRPHTQLQWTMFPASIPYITGMTGTALLLLFVCHLWLDRPAHAKSSSAGSALLPAPLLRTARLFSRYSLTLYILHHAAHLYPMWLVGLWLQNDPTIYWRQALHWKFSLIFAVIFLAASVPLVFAIDRRGTSTIETLMRWLCDNCSKNTSQDRHS